MTPAAGAGAGPVSARLPDFPWDRLAPLRELAAAHPGGIVDLSVGTPVDPSPPLVRAALAAAADAPGYPLTAGSVELRSTLVGWLRRRLGAGAIDPSGVLPTIGSKELVGSLPLHLGLGPGDLVVVPELAYPTYEVGARLAGCEVVRTDSLVGLGPRRPALVWVNSPSNPTGRVLPVAHLAKMVAWTRERGAVLVSDECYLDLGFADDEAAPVSVLRPEVCGGSYDGVLALHSLSKRSSLAGYRAGFVSGDPKLVGELLAVRKNLGLMVPAPVQQAAVAALGDETHVSEQRERYRRRRDVLRLALAAAGFDLDHSVAGLYLWATRHEPCGDTLGWLAERGVLVAPGDFYGPAGARHVRIALTATDERVDAAAARLHR
ncbi:succinyldiaminopimelate transaminase [soil metagenome]